MEARARQAAHWLAIGEVGESSKTMALWLGFDQEYRHASHPYDPADFDRCLRLLAMAPDLRPRLGDMAQLSLYWKALVERWAEVEESHLDEVGLGWSKAKRAKRTYDLMQSIYESVRSPTLGAEKP